MPGLVVRVHDAYAAGEGMLHAALFGLFTVADLRGTRDIAEGELIRFLAETAWYPTALLPGQGVRWDAVFEDLPRQGPGSKTCAAEALALCRELPESPSILDLGCGVGAQTLYLAELTSGVITAIDSHAPSIDRLRSTVAERGLSHRIAAVLDQIAEEPEMHRRHSGYYAYEFFLARRPE